MLRSLLIGLVLTAVSCGGHGDLSADAVSGPFTWGGVSNVTGLSHLWFSGQPDAAALERAKAEGITVVINLRDPSEFDWDERSAVESLGLTYYNVPVVGEGFDPEAFERIETLVHQHHDEQVLLHCASSNRVGGWLATHMVSRHDMSVDEALEIGRRTGITKPVIEERVHLYLAADED